MRVISKHRNSPQVPTLFSVLLFTTIGMLLVTSSHAQITLDGTQACDFLITGMTIAFGLGGTEAVQNLLHIELQVNTVLSRVGSINRVTANGEDLGFVEMVSRSFSFKEAAMNRVNGPS